MSLISIIIPAYNQADYLAKAIESVIQQTYKKWECLIIDDGSKDHTFRIVKKFKDPRIWYIRQENQGLSAARNTGIRLAQGKYLTFLDADDMFLPDKLVILADMMEQKPNLALVAGGTRLIDQDGKPILRPFRSQIPSNLVDFLFGNPLHVGSVLLNKEWQQKIGFFDVKLKSYEDWDYWLRIARAGGQMVSTTKEVSLYRFHTQQMTRNHQQMTQASFNVLDNFFADEHLSPDWVNQKDKAYSQAYLRAAANAYVIQHFSVGQMYLAKAIELNPSLQNNNASLLVNRMIAWSEHPKVVDPIAFLEEIFSNLPGAISSIFQTQKRSAISRASISHAFYAYQLGDLDKAYHYLKIAVRSYPAWLKNRGVLSIFRHAFIKKGKEYFQSISQKSKKDKIHTTLFSKE